MRKSALFSIIFTLTVIIGFAQANILNARVSPEEVGVRSQDQIDLDNDRPLPYGDVDDRDILWSKMVWEIIDLDERANFPLYFPIDTNNISKTRRSLFDVLVKNIKRGKIRSIYNGSYFNTKTSMKDIGAAMVLTDTTDVGYEQFNAEGYVDQQYIIKREISSADIQQYRVKGLWYFNKRQGELKYRLLGIAPVAPDVNFMDAENPELVELFWVWYPDAREALHEAKAFNDRNSSKPISFDHILNSRRFSSIIYKEENVYGDRQVKDYIYDDALMQLLESQRIKEKIRDFEQDMWAH